MKTLIDFSDLIDALTKWQILLKWILIWRFGSAGSDWRSGLKSRRRHWPEIHSLGPWTQFIHRSNNEIRAADGSVFVDIVACIGGRKLYAILRVARAVSMRRPRGDRSVVQKFGLHPNTRRRPREHHKTVSENQNKKKKSAVFTVQCLNVYLPNCYSMHRRLIY